jgi:hypothetical protein
VTNSISLEEFGRWHTPAPILDGWQWRIRLSARDALLTDKPAPAELTAPVAVAAPDGRPAKVIQTPTRAKPMQPRRKPQPVLIRRSSVVALS